MCSVAVRVVVVVVVVVGKMVVVAYIGTYLFSIFVTLTCIFCLIIAPLYWGVDDVLQSLSDLFDFIFLVYIFSFSSNW